MKTTTHKCIKKKKKEKMIKYFTDAIKLSSNESVESKEE